MGLGPGYGHGGRTRAGMGAHGAVGRRVYEAHRAGPQEKEPNVRNTRLIFTVFVAIVLMAGAYSIYVINREKDEKVTVKLLENAFMGGSRRVLVNATYSGHEAYIELPYNASVENASFTVKGALPPQRMSFEAGRSPSHVAVADLDGDHFTDVLVLNYVDNTIMVMRNLVGERLERSGTYDTGDGPIRAAAADLDSDGWPDALVLSEDSHDVRVFFNNQRGGFRTSAKPISVDLLPTDLVFLDVEMDGDMDFAVSSQNNDTVSLYLNDGHGRFERGCVIELSGSPQSLAVDDFDVDGRPDLAISNTGGRAQILNVEKGRMMNWSHTVSVWRNNGDRNFTMLGDELATQKMVSSMDTGDFNGDGYPDITLSHRGYKAVSLLLSDGSGWFLGADSGGLNSREFPAYDPICIEACDIDGDGKMDAIALTKSADSIMIFHGDGNGGLDPYVQYYTGLSPSSFTLLDFDGDGDRDIVTSDWRGPDLEKLGNGTVSILINMRNGIFGSYLQYRTGNSPRGIFTRDLNGDGHPEIATANYFGSTVSILTNNGVGRFTKQKDYPIGLEPYAVVLEDFDGDGQVDCASADEANFRIVILRSDGEGGFTNDRYLYDIGGYPFSLRTADIDGDGDIDLYTSNFAQNSTTLMFNDGSGDFDTMFTDFRTIYLGDRMPYDALVADLNGDGQNDMLTVNRGDDLDPTDTVSVLLNDGTYAFREARDYKVGKAPSAAVIFDLDGDGDLDIATSNMADDSISVLVNDGSGYFSMLAEYPVGDRPLYLKEFDYDGDGWMDLAVTGSHSNNLVIMRNAGGVAFTTVCDINIGSFPFMIEADDLNGDGRDELAITSVNTGMAVVLGTYYYPSDIHIDVGSDSQYELIHTGSLETGTVVDITDSLNDYLSRADVESGLVRIPVSVIAGKEGIVELNDLLIVYTLD